MSIKRTKETIKIGEFNINKELLEIIFNVRKKKRGEGRAKSERPKERLSSSTPNSRI